MSNGSKMKGKLKKMGQANDDTHQKHNKIQENNIDSDHFVLPPVTPNAKNRDQKGKSRDVHDIVQSDSNHNVHKISNSSFMPHLNEINKTINEQSILNIHSEDTLLLKEKVKNQNKFQVVPPDCVCYFPKEQLNKLAQTLLVENEKECSQFNKRKQMFKKIQERVDDLQDDFNLTKKLQNQKSNSLFRSKKEQLLMQEIALRAQQENEYLERFYLKPLEERMRKLPKGQLDNGMQMSVNLKHEEEIYDISKKYGIVPKEKIGDTIAVNTNQENLKKIVEKHYKRTQMKNYEESVKEMRNFFDITNPMKRKRNDSSLQNSDRLMPIDEKNELNKKRINLSINLQSQNSGQDIGQNNQSYQVQPLSSLSIAQSKHRRIKDSTQYDGKFLQTFSQRKVSHDIFHDKLVSKIHLKKPSLIQVHNFENPLAQKLPPKTSLNSPSERSFAFNDSHLNIQGLNQTMTDMKINNANPFLKTMSTNRSKYSWEKQESANQQLHDFTVNVKEKLTTLIVKPESQNTKGHVEEFNESKQIQTLHSTGRQSQSQRTSPKQVINILKSFPLQNFKFIYMIYSFIESIMANDNQHQFIHVANKFQFKEIQRLFNDYYQYYEPDLKIKNEPYHKSIKNMSLRDIENLAGSKNLLNTDIDRKLAQHLNRLLTNKKEDQFFSEKYKAYIRKQPKTEKSDQLTRMTRKMMEDVRLKQNESKVVASKIQELNNEVQTQLQNSIQQSVKNSPRQN
eukprot:403339279